MGNFSKTTKAWLARAVALVMTLSVYTPAMAFAATDTAGHWAEATMTAWQEKGMISGYEDGSLRPDAAITRAEFVQLINKAKGFTETGDVNFTDVNQGDWFYNGVAIAMGAGYCSGFPDGTFQPNAVVTRAQAAGFVANAANLEPNAAGAASLTDSASLPSWATGAIGAVISAGYMSGYPDGSFQGDKTLTRAEAVSTLDRVIGGGTGDDDTTAPSEDDVVLSNEGATLQNETIEGNVVISDELGNGSAYIKDSTIEGDLLVEGGGANSIHLINTIVKGKVIANKANVRIVAEGSTEVKTVEIKKAATLDKANGFNGTIGQVSITGATESGQQIIIRIATDTIDIEAKASLLVGATAKTVNVSEDAKDAKIEVQGSAKVTTLVADARITLSGSGTIEKLEANASGITKSSSLTVSETETASGVDKPSISTGGSSGGGSGSGGGSSSNDKPKVVDMELVTAPTKKSYEVGEKIDLTGMELNLIRSNGTKVSVTKSKLTENAVAVTPADGTVVTAAMNGNAIKASHAQGGELILATIEVKGAQPPAKNPTIDTVTITGSSSYMEGDTLTANVTKTDIEDSELNYQWMEADDANGTNAADIVGETNPTFDLKAAQATKYVAVKVSHKTNADITATSAYVGPVLAKPVDVSAGQVTLATGTNKVTLKLTGGTFKASGLAIADFDFGTLKTDYIPTEASAIARKDDTTVVIDLKKAVADAPENNIVFTVKASALATKATKVDATPLTTVEVTSNKTVTVNTMQVGNDKIVLTTEDALFKKDAVTADNVKVTPVAGTATWTDAKTITVVLDNPVENANDVTVTIAAAVFEEAIATDPNVTFTVDTIQHTISGKVTGDISKAAVAGATVSFKMNSAAGATPIEVTTNPNGAYTVALPRQEFTGTVTATGYASGTILAFTPDADTTKDVELTATASNITESYTGVDANSGTITLSGDTLTATSPKTAKTGAKITINVEPKEGYSLVADSLKVTTTSVPSGIEVKPVGDTGLVFEFTMPGEAVTVAAELKADPTEPTDFELDTVTATYAADKDTLEISSATLKATGFTADLDKIKLGGTAVTGSETFADGKVTIVLTNANTIEQLNGFTANGKATGGLELEIGAFKKGELPSKAVTADVQVSGHAVAKSISIGNQAGTVTTAGGDVTYELTTAGFDASKPVSIAFYDSTGNTQDNTITGISAAGNVTSAAKATLTLTVANTVPAGTYYFKVTADGVTSNNVGTLEVKTPDQATTAAGVIEKATISLDSAVAFTTNKTDTVAAVEAAVKAKVDAVSITNATVESVTWTGAPTDLTSAGTYDGSTFTVAIKGASDNSTADATIKVDVEITSNAATAKTAVEGGTFNKVTVAYKTDKATTVPLVIAEIATQITALNLQNLAAQNGAVAVWTDVDTDFGNDDKTMAEKDVAFEITLTGADGSVETVTKTVKVEITGAAVPTATPEFEDTYAVITSATPTEATITMKAATWDDAETVTVFEKTGATPDKNVDGAIANSVLTLTSKSGSLTAGTEYTIKVQKGSATLSEASVPFKLCEIPAAPEATDITAAFGDDTAEDIDAVNTLTLTNSSAAVMEYSTDGTTWEGNDIAASGSATIATGLTAGVEVQVRFKADPDNNKAASEPFKVCTVVAAPTADEIKFGAGSTGKMKMTGITTAMEYAIQKGGSGAVGTWTSATADAEVEVTANDIVYVRTAAANPAPASLAVAHEVLSEHIGK